MTKITLHEIFLDIVNYRDKLIVSGHTIQTDLSLADTQEVGTVITLLDTNGWLIS